MNAFIFLRPDYGLKIAGLLLAAAVCFYCYTNTEPTSRALRAKTNHHAIAHGVGKSVAERYAFTSSAKLARIDASLPAASADWRMASR